MLAVAGLTFAYTSCTDYSKDIDKNSEEIESLGGRLATAEQQIASLKTDVASLQTAKAEAEKAIAALQTSLTALQTKHDADVKALKAEYAAADEALKAEIQKKIDESNAAHEKDVEDVTKLITALQTKVSNLETEVGKINETIKTLATKEYVDGTFATKNALTAAEEKIGALRTDLTAAGDKITALEGKYDSEVKISEILDRIDAAKKAAHVADSLAKKSLGDVDALKTALGVYAEKGALEAKIALLDKADSTLKAELATKFNSADFDKTFDEALKRTLATEGNVVSVEIANQITTAKTELEGKISALKSEVDTKFARLFAISNELRSLVFIPNLYVDGVEATEYTYATYLPKTTPTKKDKVVDPTFPDQNNQGQFISVECQLLDKQWWDYADPTESKREYIDPTYTISYQMNPSNAKVNAEDIQFVSDDKEFIKTRAKSNSDPQASLVSATDGVLKIGLKASGKDIAAKGPNDTDHSLISVLALQAKVRRSETGDTTITSDYAALYGSKLEFLAIAFANKDYKGEVCGAANTNPNHLWNTAKKALQNVPSCTVAYNDKLDLNEIVRTIIKTDSKSNARKAADHTVYEDYITKAGVETDFNIKYEFELVDYIAGLNETSESQHAYLKDGVFIPCGTTEGVRNNKTDVTSVGRRPLVRVTVLDGRNNKVILVGFIKIEIVKTTGYQKTNEFTNWTVDFGCVDQVKTTTWSEMIDNVIKLDTYSKEEFCLMYELQKNANNEAIQYVFDGTNFEVANAAAVRGVVTEKTDAVPGTTTDVLKWTLDPKSMSLIYQGANHSAHVWVRYVYKGTTPTSIYEGIYVRLDVTVRKPAATVGVKLDEYWFKNQENAKINVRAPHTVSDPYDHNNATYAWVTDTKQVWEGNAPKFTAKTGATYAKYDASTYKVKYYFAPVQPKVGNYQLYAASAEDVRFVNRSKTIVDKFDTRKNFNVEINAATGVITTKEGELAARSNDGIYENAHLLCEVGGTVYEIACLDQTSGAVTYKHNLVSEAILNLTKSDPANKYEDSKLYANIGMAYYSGCDVVMPVDGEINPYYFLRPINIDPAKGKYYRDAVDYHKEESNLDVLDLLSFSDWRGEAFFKPAVGETPADYSNIWYFAYYNINSVKVDIDNVTTNMNESDPAKFVNLATKTTDIMLSHCFGKHTDVKATGLNVVSGWYENGDGYNYAPSKEDAATVSVDTHFAACEPLVWGETEYMTLVSKFGFIRYHNNKSTVSKDFKLRIPIAIGYDWGTITTTVEVDVKAL